MFKISEKFKRIVALSVAIMLFVLLLSSAVVYFTGSADQQEDLENKQQDLINDRNEIENEIDGLESQKLAVLDEKKKLDIEVSAIEGKIADINKKIEDTTAELEMATEALDTQYKLYGERVRVMYENSSNGYLDIILSSKSVGDFFDKMDIVAQIAEYDKNLTEELKAEQQRIMAIKAELETDKLVLVEEKTELDKKMNARDALIREINSTKSSLEEQLKIIEKEEQEVRLQIARLSGKGPVYTGGAMLWPTPSCKYITSYYGWRLHPVLGYEKLHTGMDIGAGYNANIIAAASGTVITATYNSAYGNYVVIDHGGGVCTLYAHQSSMAVSVGQYVSAGEVIGYVGSTGYSTGPHLHFEVIINGSTVDPLGYVS